MNVCNYTDDELYLILGFDADRPPKDDNELADAIESFVDEHGDNPEAQDVVSFFEDIYAHFFPVENSEEEEEPSLWQRLVGDTFSDKRETFVAGTDNDTDAVGVDANFVRLQEATQKEAESIAEDVTQLNPFLKPTSTRLLTIDSSYRDVLYLNATDFSFTLSQPLKNVIMMKLSSVQIPYTWWTINNAYGSNFFYLKGNSAGINDGAHDYQIQIPVGNYSSADLVVAINTAIDDMASIATDTDFTGTEMTYTSTSAQMTTKVHLTKYYNETDYVLQFPTDISTVLTESYYTIPDFIGLTYTQVGFTHVFSQPSYVTIESQTAARLYYVNDYNKFFTICQYTTAYPATGSADTGKYTPYSTYVDGSSTLGTSTIDASYVISLTLPSDAMYTPYEIYSNLQTVMQSNTFLNADYSYVQQNTRADNNSNSTQSLYYFDLNVKLNRMTTLNVPLCKYFVVFPDESTTAAVVNPRPGYRIWTTLQADGVSLDSTATTSVFSFPLGQMEVGQWTSLHSPDPTSYNVPNPLTFSFRCIKTYYENEQNNVYGTVTGGNGLVISDYFTNIVNGLVAANASTVDVAHDPSGIFNMTNTTAYYNHTDLKAYFQVDMTKTFLRDYYYMYVQNSILGKAFNWYVTASSGFTSTLGALDPFYIDLGTSQFQTKGYCINASYFPVNSTNDLITVCTKSTAPNADVPNIELHIPSNAKGSYNNVFELAAAVQEAFVSYSDSDNDYIFKGTTCVGSVVTNVLHSITVKLTLTVQITKLITEKDYEIVFYDDNDSATNSNNYIGWYEQLKMDSSYNLLSSWQMGYSVCAGSVQMDFADFYVDASNATFSLVPVTPGVAGSSSIDFTLDRLGYYSNLQLIAAMNSKISSNAATTGSTITLDPVTNCVNIRVYVVKKFTAQDYRIVFYDQDSFITCNLGTSGTYMNANNNSSTVYLGTTAYNTTWDTTLGWYLGYHSAQEYALQTSVLSAASISNTNYWDSSNEVFYLLADTVADVNVTKSVIIDIDDYNSSTMTNSLVTVGTNDISLPNPSYMTYYKSLKCELDTLATTTDHMEFNYLSMQSYTQRQIYSIKQTLTDYTALQQLQTEYTYGPQSSNIFAVVPIQMDKLKQGIIYTDSSGPLANNYREYFGPVNIDRMRIRLFTDKGTMLDLNGSDFIITLLVEQMYNGSATTKR